jgi:hypothetical protein
MKVVAATVIVIGIIPEYAAGNHSPHALQTAARADCRLEQFLQIL